MHQGRGQELDVGATSSKMSRKACAIFKSWKNSQVFGSSICCCVSLLVLLLLSRCLFHVNSWKSAARWQRPLLVAARFHRERIVSFHPPKSVIGWVGQPPSQVKYVEMKVGWLGSPDPKKNTINNPGGDSFYRRGGQPKIQFQVWAWHLFLWLRNNQPY